MPYFQEFYRQLLEISPGLPKEPLPMEYCRHMVFIDRYTGELFTPYDLNYLRDEENSSYYMACSSSVGREFAFYPEDFLRSLVAYGDRDGELHVHDYRLVNDILLKSTKASSDAVGKPATKENVVAEPKNEQRPYWMP